MQKTNQLERDQLDKISAVNGVNDDTEIEDIIEDGEPPITYEYDITSY